MIRHLVLVLPSALALMGAAEYTAAERRHWAFQKRSRPQVPQASSAADRAWVSNPIDAFVLERLQKEGLRPAPAAGRATLIRRLYFDITGLPPTPAEVAAFLRDRSPNAWEKLVDRVLQSPHYGERWGQHWLDVVRFAETDGFEYDTHRNGAWRYRDYVIGAFNTDKPYDRFVLEQLAGDEIAPHDQEARIAAGLQRLGPLRKNAGNQEVASSRNEVLTEMTNVVGSALLGVTLGCARCHDHKFDPIRHKDYYRIQAYFAATFDEDRTLASPDEQSAHKAKVEAAEKDLKEMRARMRKMSADERKAAEDQVKQIEARMPDPLPALFTVKNDLEKPTPIHVLARGDFAAKGEPVGMRPLGVLLADGAAERTGVVESPRSKLAEWIVDPENPLTARVMANRVWNWHFGRGIVATPNDFGRMGDRPSHRELLDWLANSLVDGGWKLKPLHKMILMSSAYRQSSKSPIASAAVVKDTDNRLLWRFNRRRLEAEEVRDAMLAVAGRLNPKTGGPSVITPVDKDLVNLLYKPSQWKVADDVEEHNRRSVYLIAKRNLRLPLMEVFDAPDLQSSCGRRESSTHAPQALELLNGDLSNRLARALAARLTAEAGADPRQKADLAWRLTTGRAPTAVEMRRSVEFLRTQPVSEFALVMLNLNAFLYVD